MKKVLTGLLVTALMLLVSNGFKENEITISIETFDHSFSAGVKETDSDQRQELSSINVAEHNETPPEIHVEKQPEAVPTQIVKGTMNIENYQVTAKPPEAKSSTSELPVQQPPAAAEPVPENAAEPEPDPNPVLTSVPAENEHVHSWTEEVIYHEAVTHTVHHDAVTEERRVSVIHETMYFCCDTCGKRFSSQQEAYAHEDATMEAAIEANDMTLFHPGHSSVIERTDDGYYETVVTNGAYDELIVDEPAWEEHFLRCKDCGATA